MQLWTHESLDIGLFERTIVLSWTHEKVFVRSWSDYRAFKTAYFQTIVRSKLHMSRLSCVQSYLWSDYRAFQVAYVQTIVRSKLHMSRLSCVQNCICPDYRAFKIAYVQTIVRSKLHMSRLSCVRFFSRPCNFERTTPPSAFISVWTYRLSVWHLNLGPGWGARPKVDMSRPSQTESVYVQTLPDGKCLCPDFRAFKIFRAFIVRSKVLMSRLSCVQNCLCPDFRAFQKKIRALQN